MKDKKDIFSRAIILLSLSDRCSLEKSVIAGKPFSIEIRENQQNAIYQWLTNNKYVDLMNSREKQFFKQKIGTVCSDDVSFFQMQYECIEPCLWTLGLIQNLHGYDNFVIDDFHPALEIGKEHSMEKLIQKYKSRNFDEVKLQNEVSMLWYWRMIEINNPIFNEKPIDEVIKSLFGQRYGEVIEILRTAQHVSDDFMINGTAVNRLSNIEVNKLISITRWRYHAFAWITGNEEWEKVELNT